jgi:hypothetical protein
LIIAFSSRTVERSFAVESVNVGVYWDHEATSEVTYVEWGELEPGSTRRVMVYVRNGEAAQSCHLYVWAQDWTPPQAASCVRLLWEYDGETVAPGDTVEVLLALRIEPYAQGIEDFSFTIHFWGTDSLIGDFNHDGVVDIFDVSLIALSFGTNEGEEGYIAVCDIDEDGDVDLFDLVMVAKYYNRY